MRQCKRNVTRLGDANKNQKKKKHQRGRVFGLAGRTLFAFCHGIRFLTFLTFRINSTIQNKRKRIWFTFWFAGRYNPRPVESFSIHSISVFFSQKQESVQLKLATHYTLRYYVSLFEVNSGLSFPSVDGDTQTAVSHCVRKTWSQVYLFFLRRLQLAAVVVRQGRVSKTIRATMVLVLCQISSQTMKTKHFMFPFGIVFMKQLL